MGAPLTPLSGRASDPATFGAPNLTWEPYPGAHHYRVLIGQAGQTTAEGDPVFFEPISADYVNNNLSYPAVTETNARYQKLGASYQWIVTAYDASNVPLAQSPLSVYTIKQLNPTAGQALALNGMTLAAGGGCTAHLTDGVNGPRCEGVPTTPVLSWDPLPGASHYMVYVSRDKGFTNLLEPEQHLGRRPTRCTHPRSTTTRTPTRTSKATDRSTGSFARAEEASAARPRCRPLAWPPTPSSSFHQQ